MTLSHLIRRTVRSARANGRTDASQPVDQAPTTSSAPSGPVPLEPHELGLVAGGDCDPTPKGGWTSPTGGGSGH